MNPGISLYDHQEEAHSAVFREWNAGNKRTLVVRPTGTGKTRVFTAIAGDGLTSGRFNRVGVMAHTDHLIRQPFKSFEEHYPQLTRGVVMADENLIGRQVTIMSVQTAVQPKRMKALPPLDALVIDEAHHAVAASYQKVVKHLFRLNPDMVLLGVTATPARADGKGLGRVFDSIASQRSIGEMYHAGYLTYPRGFVIQSDTDLSGLKPKMQADGWSDYEDKELSKRINTEIRNRLIIDAWDGMARDRTTMVFAADVRHAQDLAGRFTAAGARAAAVWGNMPGDDYDHTMQAFESGDIGVLVNCMKLVEGYDLPRINCIILGKPDGSQAMVIQKAGRGLRKFPGKDDCLLLFVADKTAKLGLDQYVSLMDQDASDPDEETVAQRTRRTTVGGAAVTELDLLGLGNLRSSVVPVELIRQSPLAWSRHVSSSGHVYYVLPVGEDETAIVQRRGDGYEMLGIDHQEGRSFLISCGDEIQPLLSQRFEHAHRKDDPHRRGPATDSQRELLWSLAPKKLGGQIEWMSAGEAADHISYLMAMRTLRVGQ